MAEVVWADLSDPRGPDAGVELLDDRVPMKWSAVTGVDKPAPRTPMLVANQGALPVIVRDEMNAQACTLTVVESLQRKDLTPTEEAYEGTGR